MTGCLHGAVPGQLSGRPLALTAQVPGWAATTIRVGLSHQAEGGWAPCPGQFSVTLGAGMATMVAVDMPGPLQGPVRCGDRHPASKGQASRQVAGDQTWRSQGCRGLRAWWRTAREAPADGNPSRVKAFPPDP